MLEPGTVVLYPSKSAISPDQLTVPPTRLILLDATWKYAGELWTRNEWLHALPAVVLPCTEPMDFSQLRRPKASGQMCTAEAAASALACFRQAAASDSVFSAIRYLTGVEQRARK